MYRDFTYVDDLVYGISSLIDVIPDLNSKNNNLFSDSLSPVAPYRVVNIGNSNKVKLLDFIEIIEEILGKKAIRNYMPMQKGDLSSTWADTTLLQNLIGNQKQTNLKHGVANFINWFKEYYNL